MRRPDRGSPLTLPFELRKKHIARSLPRRGDPGATSAPLKKHQETSGDSEESAGSGAITQSGGPGDGYHPYTTTHDRIVNAAALAGRAELAALHLKLQAALGTRQPAVA